MMQETAHSCKAVCLVDSTSNAQVGETLRQLHVWLGLMSTKSQMLKYAISAPLVTIVWALQQPMLTL
jgi:hypothetical protein